MEAILLNIPYLSLTDMSHVFECYSCSAWNSFSKMIIVSFKSKTIILYYVPLVLHRGDNIKCA